MTTSCVMSSRSSTCTLLDAAVYRRSTVARRARYSATICSTRNPWRARSRAWLRDGTREEVEAVELLPSDFAADDKQRVVARFDDGSEVTADLLVAADGVPSTVPWQLLPAVEPRYAG